MRGNVTELFAWLRALPHPSEALLIALGDGELPSAQEAKIRAHLQSCPLCRAQAEQLQYGLQLFDRSWKSSRAEFSIGAELQKLMSVIDTSGRRAGGLSEAAEGSPLYKRLLAELSIYLGDRAALQLLRRCCESGAQREELQETLAPIVIGFLGQHTGAAVLANVDRIWDQSREMAS